nr:prephenate dehydratase domain-containing protein [Maliibacterium massiliense]
MEDLYTLRTRLDALDRELIALFEQRMALCVRIGAYKAENDLPVFQPEREAQVLESRLALLEDASWRPYAQDFVRTLMEISKQAQRALLEKKQDLRVAYQGIEGGYGEEAASVNFPDQAAQRVAYPTFADVVEALLDNRADYGVLPLENSATGPIAAVMDLLLANAGLYIVGEYNLPVSHCLLGVPGAALSDITTVYSHEQGFAQCRAFLSEHPAWQCVPVRNTALAAQMVSQQGNAACAAIASARAAAIYRLDILQRDIQSQSGNSTRFCILAHTPRAAGEKTALAFTGEQAAAGVSDAIRTLAAYGVPLLALHARPGGGRFGYRYFMEIAGGAQKTRTQQALAQIQAAHGEVRLMGSYCASKGRGFMDGSKA